MLFRVVPGSREPATALALERRQRENSNTLLLRYLTKKSGDWAHSEMHRHLANPMQLRLHAAVLHELGIGYEVALGIRAEICL